MARALLLTTIYIVVLTCANSERRPFLRYSKYLQKELPHHWKHDQEELGRRVDTVARGHQAAALEPLEPQEPPWRRWTKEGRQAALQPDTNKQLRNIRKRLLEKKLKPNHQSRLIIHNKKTSMEANLHRMPRVKRDLMVMKDEGAERVLGVQSSAQQQQQQQQGVRARRQVLINPVLMPEVVMQPHIQAPLQQNQETQYQERVEQKRDKRHVLYLINKPATVYTGPRATVNPFIREANTDDYEIVRPQSPYQGPPMGPGSDVDSYHINEEASEFSKIISDFYLATDSEHWPEIHQFAKHILSPFTRLTERRKNSDMKLIVRKNRVLHGKELLGFGYKIHTWKQFLPVYRDIKRDRIKRNTNFQMPKELQNIKIQKHKNTRKRKKRKKRPPKLLGKALNRKQLKKRKQKERRFEAKRLRMRTHARRLRKQQKYKAARLQRHYARMNLTTTAVPEYFGTPTAGIFGEKENHKLESSSDSKVMVNYEHGSKDSKDIDSKDEDDYEGSSNEDEYEESYEDDDDDDDDDKPDIGNFEYEEYDEDDDDDDDEEDGDGEDEYVSYENVTDEPVKTKDNRIETIKKRA